MPTNKATLLLVEDDAVLRELFSTILSISGYRVHSAEDGFDALAKIESAKPDVVLSDLYMPGMTGFELLSVVRRRFPSIPVVAMSSAFSKADVPVGLAADAFYEKATEPSSLLEIIETIQTSRGLEEVLPRRKATPLWIEWNNHKDVKQPQMVQQNKPHVTLSCPACMRTFLHPADTDALALSDAICIYCAGRVSYALVQTVVTESSKAAALAKAFLLKSKSTAESEAAPAKRRA